MSTITLHSNQVSKFDFRDVRLYHGPQTPQEMGGQWEALDFAEDVGFAIRDFGISGVSMQKLRIVVVTRVWGWSRWLDGVGRGVYTTVSIGTVGVVAVQVSSDKQQLSREWKDNKLKYD